LEGVQRGPVSCARGVGGTDWLQARVEKLATGGERLVFVVFPYGGAKIRRGNGP